MRGVQINQEVRVVAENQQESKKPKSTRREFVKKAAYVAPAILTLAAAPEFAKAGSVKPKPDKKPLPNEF